MKNYFKSIAFLLLVVPMFLFAEEAATVANPAEETAKAIQTLTVGLDTLWVLVAGMLVFFMNAGFALVESGFAQSKNTVNILAKNFIVFAAATFSYWAIGWGLMFGDGTPFYAKDGIFFLTGLDNSPALGDDYKGVYSSMNWTGVPLLAKFFFQLVFAATAATIVSGAVAERIKFHSFLIFSFILVAVMYPFTGHWVWGGGWLAELGFHDFAGSTVVHSVGGWAALAGAIVLGARKGKFLPDGRIKPILGHNMTSAALGTLILWLGWFGFNPGSTMGVGDGVTMAHVIVTTNISAALGALASTVTAWIILKKPDLGMILNGTLAGLVGITAPCAIVSPTSAAIIGAVSGVLVVLSVLFFDKIKIDDPVGATSVHLVCGIWGTLAVAIFGYEGSPAGVDVPSILTQLYGILAIGGFTFVVSLALWFVLKLAGGIRVSEEEELSGLDLGEHGAEAYPDFNIRVRG
ncbi:ammonium transporter [Leptospira yanagawae serovar Saopaulo str. Sao Paulo = ATCC 700523]|uniref:Ammonium transporter n=2 Tax=Leptospira yanagawae TaxID=293069 RepID=A0ABY2M256_9LEPT|nr:ammonium transporter [Leptospira yanagawae]EOQ87609.1 ammonium transporter [Leptospira yanagawae serovar Saopaulo str. Sao Paulo = ATCC 700523]TGL21817.1 ammonium transporter [Leptospira yanagawae]